MENYSALISLSMLFVTFGLFSIILIIVKVVLGSFGYVSAILEVDYFYEKQSEFSGTLTNMHAQLSEVENSVIAKEDELTRNNAA